MTSSQAETGSWEPQPPPLTRTIDLLERFKQGDENAVELLIERALPPLRIWARGRLPGWARGCGSSRDLVEDAVVLARAQLKTLDARHPAALQVYLRRAIVNHIRREMREGDRHEVSRATLDDQRESDGSFLQQAIGGSALERYEAALERLAPLDREAIVMRVELQQSYEEVAIAMAEPTPEAARTAVARAVKHLILIMNEDR
jgi:DNA-directed RNA polymerase specialized sigma24 family protein